MVPKDNPWSRPRLNGWTATEPQASKRLTAYNGDFKDLEASCRTRS